MDERDQERRRRAMVDLQIRGEGVEHPGVLAAMTEVPRHRFVAPELQRYAYDDSPVQIGHGQTISQPYIVGYMTEQLAPRPDHRVLEIGCGSGYQAAILSRLVKAVYTVDIEPELVESAKVLFRELGYTNIHAKVADGYHGWREEAPFDSILVAAAAQEIPHALVEQLKPGGRMLIPIGAPQMPQVLVLVEKDAAGAVQTRSLLGVAFVPFRRG